MADSDIRDNTSETSKLNESLLSSIKTTEDLKREIDTLNKQKVEPAQAQARLSATAGPTLSPAEEMRRAVQTAIRQSAQATTVRPSNPLPSRPTETARPPQAMSPTSTIIRPPQPTQPTRTTITPQQLVRAVPIETPRKQEPSSNPASSQHNQSKVEVLQPTPKDSTRQEATPQRSNMGKGAASGWAWVGEHGKELVHFQGGETVLSHDKSVDKTDKGLSSLPGYASGTPNPPPPPPNPHPLDPTIQELHRRIDALEVSRKAGIGGGTPIGQQLLERARQQTAYLANRYARLSPQQQQAPNPKLQQVSHRMRRVEEDEINRRRKLNNELTRGQYAVAEFAANLSRGDVGGAIGAAAGGVGGKAGVFFAIARSLLHTAIKLETQQTEKIQRGGVSLSPSGADTETSSSKYFEMQLARQSGELKRQNSASRQEQLRRQAYKMGMTPSTDIQFSGRQSFWRFGNWKNIAMHMQGITSYFKGKTPTEISNDFSKTRSDYYEDFIKQKGGKPKPTLRNMEIPGVQAGITSNLQYQSQLQVNSLQRQDLDNAILQEQLSTLAEVASLLSDIRSNTNGLERINPVWT